MKIGQIINEYARIYSPYMNGLVNHLPMGQMALYKMGNDMDRIESYSEEYIRRGRMDPVKEEYEKVDSIEESLGKRDSYEGCVDFIRDEVESKGMDKVIKNVLNDYPLGISSGLFHTTIRLAYGVEGVEEDGELGEEVERALAYYITAYRPGKKFTRRVSSDKFKNEVKAIIEDPHIKKLIVSESTRGQTMKALYNDERYLEIAPLIEGSNEDKVITLLEFLLPIFDGTNSIVVLHCITGLHALLVLEEYYNDFHEMLDIMTAFIITHILTMEEIKTEELEGKKDISWDTIIKKASSSSNVHTIKFIYSAKELHKMNEMTELKRSAWSRVLKD